MPPAIVRPFGQRVENLVMVCERRIDRVVLLTIQAPPVYMVVGPSLLSLLLCKVFARRFYYATIKCTILVLSGLRWRFNQLLCRAIQKLWGECERSAPPHRIDSIDAPPYERIWHSCIYG